MFFNISNVPASFQGYIIKILVEILDIFVIIYWDDILIYISKINHINSIQWVINQFQKYSLYVNLKKICFYKKKIKCFDYFVFLQSIYIKDARI